LGTVVVPFPSVKVGKYAELATDVNKDGLYSPGDTIKYTIRVINQSPRDIAAGAFTIIDPVLDQATYVAGSTKYSCSVGSTLLNIADGPSNSPFPLDGTGLVSPCILKGKGGEHAISFLAKINSSLSKKTIVNSGTMKIPSLGPDLTFDVTIPVSVPVSVMIFV
jgi:uncharacterized repeat protein (TIGR01451 family)